MENVAPHPPRQKDAFLAIFGIAAVVLVLLPFVTTFNDVLTRLVIRLDFYRVIQDAVVPWIVRMVGVILLPFGLNPSVYGEYLSVQGGAGGAGQPFLVEIAWNCIGWQSLLFFVLTGWVALQGERYTRRSKLKAWLLGFFGTFLLNLLRIALVALVAQKVSQAGALVFHDYASTFMVLAWLFFFWWFSYAFVLEEKGMRVRR